MIPPCESGRKLSGHIDRMKSFIRDLSARAEFCLILLIGFVPLILIFQLPTALQSKHLELTTGGVLGFPLVELVILVFF